MILNLSNNILYVLYGKGGDVFEFTNNDENTYILSLVSESFFRVRVISDDLGNVTVNSSSIFRFKTRGKSIKVEVLKADDEVRVVFKNLKNSLSEEFLLN